MVVSWGGYELLVLFIVVFYGIFGRVDSFLYWIFVCFYIGLEDLEWLWEGIEEVMGYIE